MLLPSLRGSSHTGDRPRFRAPAPMSRRRRRQYVAPGASPEIPDVASHHSPEPPKEAAGRLSFVDLEIAPNRLRPTRTVSVSPCYSHPFGVRNIRGIVHDPGADAPGYVLSPPSGVRIGPGRDRHTGCVQHEPYRSCHVTSIPSGFVTYGGSSAIPGASSYEPPKAAAVCSSGREPGDPRCRIPPFSRASEGGGRTFVFCRPRNSSEQVASNTNRIGIAMLLPPLRGS